MLTIIWQGRVATHLQFVRQDKIRQYLWIQRGMPVHKWYHIFSSTSHQEAHTHSHLSKKKSFVIGDANLDQLAKVILRCVFFLRHNKGYAQYTHTMIGKGFQLNTSLPTLCYIHSLPAKGNIIEPSQAVLSIMTIILGAPWQSSGWDSALLTVVALVQSLFRELRCRKPQNMARKKKKTILSNRCPQEQTLKIYEMAHWTQDSLLSM